MSTTDTLCRGLFQSFEGMNDSGKTVQLRPLIHRLRADDYDGLKTTAPAAPPKGAHHV